MQAFEKTKTSGQPIQKQRPAQSLKGGQQSASDLNVVLRKRQREGENTLQPKIKAQISFSYVISSFWDKQLVLKNKTKLESL